MQEKINQEADTLQSQKTQQTTQVKPQKSSVYQSKEGQKPPIQTKQGMQEPYKSPQGRKPPIQAKQRPIQRTKSGNSKSSEIASLMGQQYGVDTSSLQFNHNSSFPGKVGADATIQGNKIDFAPGKDSEANIKHEVGHAIDNAKNGTPKGDQVVNGHSVNTTREAAADKMMNAPLQRKTTASVPKVSIASTQNQPVQMIARGEMGELIKEIQNKVPHFEIEEDVLWTQVTTLKKYTSKSKTTIAKELIQYARANTMNHNQRRNLVNEAIIRAQNLNASDIYGNLANGLGNNESALSYWERSSPLSNDAEQKINDMIDHTLVLAESAREDFNAKLKKVDTLLSDEDKKTQDFEIHEAPVKKKDRILDKTLNKYDKDPTRVVDIVRGSIVFKDLEALMSAEIRIRKHEIFQIVRTKNAIRDVSKDKKKDREKDAGYMDLKLNVRLANGMVGELQLQVKSLNEAKSEEGGHSLYRIIRDSDEEKTTCYHPQKDAVKIQKIASGFEKIRATLNNKANDNEHPLTTDMAQTYRRLLNDIEIDLRDGTPITITKDSGRAKMLKTISRLVYEKAAEDIKGQINDKNSDVGDYFRTLDQNIAEKDAKIKEKNALEETNLGVPQTQDWFRSKFGVTLQKDLLLGIDSLLEGIATRLAIPKDDISDWKKNVRGVLSDCYYKNEKGHPLKQKKLAKIVTYFNNHFGISIQFITENQVTFKYTVHKALVDGSPACFILSTEDNRYLLAEKKVQ
ncbi:hypothetical protein BKI52_14365 [marine bacterium AO1-C]|nr:hypothetical protein BKI52_14365 [marine bacterium AO1-C]